MAADEWFRNKRWSETLEHEFFRRLSKSRSGRDQYLVIQALTLAPEEPRTALRLTDLYFETKRNSFEDLRALTARADAYKSLGATSRVVEVFKEMLELERVKPGQRSTVYVDYPYLVATNRLTAEYASAKSILIERRRDIMFPIDRFKWHASLAIIEFEAQALVQAKLHAAEALEAAQAGHSGFRFHQKLGLVGEEHARTISTLEKIGT